MGAIEIIGPIVGISFLAILGIWVIYEAWKAIQEDNKYKFK